jgi:Dimethyladenosine transferase (rRNA methylation)
MLNFQSSTRSSQIYLIRFHHQLLLNSFDYDFDLAILMYQKEFADRMNGEVGTKNYSRLSAMLYFKCNVEKLTNVSSESFIPKPEIDSTVVRLTPKENNIPQEDFEYILIYKSVVPAQEQENQKCANRFKACHYRFE